MAQAVRLRLPEGADRMGFVVDIVTLERINFVYFRFPCQCSFRRLLRIHYSSYYPTLYSLDAISVVKYPIKMYN